MSATEKFAESITAPFEVTPDQLEEFRQHGFIKLKGVFDAETLEYFRKEVARVTEEKNPVKEVPLDERDTYGKAFIQVGNLWEADEVARQLTFSRRLAGIAATLLEVASVRLWHDQALFKEAGGGSTPWHADQQYWPMLTDRSITAWIPFQAVPLEMGPMAFAIGSHRMNIARDIEISDKSETVIADAIERYHINEHYSPYELGEVSFHLGWTLHRAGPNATDRPREVHTVIYMEGEQRLIEPESSFHQNDWDTWTPSTRVGEVMDDQKNPVLYG